MLAPEDAADHPRHLLAVEGVDAPRQADLGLVRRVRALHGAVGRGAGVQHLFPAPAMVVAARRCALLGVDGALGRLAADLLRRALDTFGQEVAEALAVADHLDQAVRAVHIAPRELEADLLLGEIALLHALHDPAADPAELVDVEAGAVEARVEPGDRFLVGEADLPAGARPSFVFRLVDQLAGLAAPCRSPGCGSGACRRRCTGARGGRSPRGAWRAPTSSCPRVVRFVV